ncbi:MAG: winged helix-turn-helix domain-containing protein [Candidatus Thorarchaeota archaeon]
MPETTDQEKKLGETIRLFGKIMDDPTRVAIWFEILRSPEISAKDLMKRINIKKTAMYYHLTILEENEVIDYSLIKKEKHYSIKYNFFDLLVGKSADLKGKEKEVDLFFLYIINSLLQKEITKLRNSPNTEYKREKYPIPLHGLWFCKKEKLEQIKENFYQMWNKIVELDEGEGPETIVNTEMVYFWGLVDFLS